MNAQERLDYLLSDVWQPTGKLVTISDLESALSNLDFGFVLVRLTLEASTQPQIVDGMSDVEIMATRANAMKMQDAVEAMRSGGGLSLSSPDRQAVIDQLATAGQWPDAVRDAVKALGGVWRKQWQVEGMGFEPTLQSVQSEIDAEIAEPDETRYEVLLSANRASDGALRVMARVTPVYFANGAELRRGEVRTLVNDAALVAALSPIIEGLIDA